MNSLVDRLLPLVIIVSGFPKYYLTPQALMCGHRMRYWILKLEASLKTSPCRTLEVPTLLLTL
jgi:hypothetical protein